MDAELLTRLRLAIRDEYPGARVSLEENPLTIFVSLRDGSEHEIGLEAGAPEMPGDELINNILEVLRR